MSEPFTQGEHLLWLVSSGQNIDLTSPRIVSRMQDGSFYVWSVRNFALVRSFTLPSAPQLRPLQQTFAVSPDGQLLVAGGAGLPVLLVYRCEADLRRYQWSFRSCELKL